MKCLAAKPIVDGIEKDLAGKVKVLRLNMLSKSGREFASRYDVKGAPTTLVIDGAGAIVHRHAGIPSRKTVVAHATG